MIQDARRLEPGTALSYDLCIVGAGPVGIALALEFAGTGLRVCLLEGGGRRQDAAAQALLDGEVVGQPYLPLAWTRLARLGGTSGWWGGECRSFDALEDLAPRPWLGQPGWPLRPCELAAFEARACRFCGLGERPFEPAEAWLREVGAEALPLDPARFATRLFRYAAPTDLASVHGPALERAANIRVLLHAVAVEVESRSGALAGVRFATAPGREHALAAPRVVLAAGGIENARLLLASRRERPAGLGNDRDQVGRGFMEHLYLDDVARFEPAPGLPPPRAYARRKRAPDGAAFRAALAPVAATLAEAGLPNLCFKLADPLKRAPAVLAAFALRRGLAAGYWPTPPQAVLGRLAAGAPGVVPALARLSRRGGPGAPLSVGMVVEQLPDPANRVTLSARRDALGRPLARLDWRLTGRDRTAWHEALALLSADLAAWGLGRLTLPDPASRGAVLERLRTACHHMGTTRMAEDPRRGVVDPAGQVHGVPGLHVAGSSVFPTGGHANPTLTAIALTLRLADHLKRGLGLTA